MVRAAMLGLICVAALLGDCLTGTIIDSPFTSFMAYAIIGMTLAYLREDESAPVAP
jgi:hypothetical protein